MKTNQDSFPVTGFTSAKQNSAFLGIGLSTWWLWVKEGKAPTGHKFGSRTTRWKAEDVRSLADKLTGEAA
ncbi:MAG: putative DNA-binding transcriptional regulator AlpA [Zhongshania marina]|jgi:prophage regulatory protein